MNLVLISVSLAPFPLTAIPAPSHFLRRPQLLICFEPPSHRRGQLPEPHS
jgi:hypothetical protein